MYFSDIYNLLSIFLITNYYLHSFSEKQLRDVPCCYLRGKSRCVSAPPWTPVAATICRSEGLK